MRLFVARPRASREWRSPGPRARGRPTERRDGTNTIGPEACTSSKRGVSETHGDATSPRLTCRERPRKLRRPFSTGGEELLGTEPQGRPRQEGQKMSKSWSTASERGFLSRKSHFKMSFGSFWSVFHAIGPFPHGCESHIRIRLHLVPVNRKTQLSGMLHRMVEPQATEYQA